MANQANPVIITNSPIEFVISGPIGGRDRVLVRTEKASLDLIALSSQNTNFERKSPPSDPFLFLLGGTQRQLNVVSSIPIPDFKPKIDQRRSSLNFAWTGLASVNRVKHIESTLNRCLPELSKALYYENKDDIEFSVAPIILACSDANEQRRRSRHAVNMLLGIYALMGAILFAYLMLKRIMLS